MDILRYLCKDPIWYQFTQMTEPERKIYRQLFHGITRFEQKIRITDVSFPKGDAAKVIFKVWGCMMDDIPEFFFMDKCTVESGRDVDVLPHYTMAPADVVAILKKIRSKTRFFIASLGLLGQQEKLRRIHDYLIEHCTYGDTRRASAHRIDGAFLEGKPVCDGFSKAAQYLCDRAGIPCIKVRGRGREGTRDSGGHAWNIVWIGKQSYHMDVTYDCAETRGKEPVRYDYFLLSDRQILLDRVMDRNGAVPACPKSFDYYMHIGVYYQRQKPLERQILAHAREKKPFLCQLPAKLGGKNVSCDLVNSITRDVLTRENMAASWRVEFNQPHQVYCIRFQ